VELFCHERSQFVGIVGQVVEHAGNGLLHRFKGVVPGAQGMFADKLPQSFDQIQVGRIGRDVGQDQRDTFVVLLGNPFLELAGVLITSVVQMEDDFLAGMLGVDFLQEFDDVGVGNGAAGLTHVDVVAILGTVSAQDVEAFASAAYAEVQTLAAQEPAAEDGFQPPDRMAGVDEVASFFFPVGQRRRGTCRRIPAACRDRP
jgi:hypothetical protein